MRHLTRSYDISLVFLFGGPRIGEEIEGTAGAKIADNGSPNC
jgi:hypothetical protein